MEKYRHLNIKLTPQRIAILNYLSGNKDHPSAEDIYLAVKKQFPTMSFATVYNTLEALKEKRVITELKIDLHKKRYDSETRPHHHLICTKCNKVFDVFKDFETTLPDDIAPGFEVVNTTIEFFGKCQKCK